MGIPLKIVTFIIQAALVVLAVFLFSYFDPFNIFNSKKLTLKDTPTIVTSIRGIGKLITAEYYGEVIKSTGEPFQLYVDSAKAAEEKRFIQLEKRIRDAARYDHRVDSLAKTRRKKNDYFRAFESDHEEIVKDPQYGEFKSIVDKETSLSEKEMIYAYYNQEEVFPIESTRKSKFPSLVSAFLDKKYELSKKEKKQNAKNGLVLLGRGWVKAGIDLSNFDQDHFHYYPDRNLVRLTNHRTEIIAATINPWFIPQKKMKGFEYIYVGNNLESNADKKESVEIINGLKLACLENLKADARQANIIGKARENAELTLGHFLSLLLGKEVKVEIYEHPLDAAAHDILKDGVITPLLIQEMDSLVGHYASTEFTRTFDFLKDIRDSLKVLPNLPWAGADQNWEMLAFYYRIQADGFYTGAEKDSVARYLAQPFSMLSGRKDFLYLATLTKPDTNFHFTGNSIPDSILIRNAFNERARQYPLLKEALAKLRSSLTTEEIRRNDGIIDGYLRAGDIASANTFAVNANEFMQEEQKADYNWQVSYLSMDAASGKDSLKLKKEIGALPSIPTDKDYFYFLFYDGKIPQVLKERKTIAGYMKANPLLKKSIDDFIQVNRRRFDPVLNVKSIKPVGHVRRTSCESWETIG